MKTKIIRANAVENSTAVPSEFNDFSMPTLRYLINVGPYGTLRPPGYGTLDPHPNIAKMKRGYGTLGPPQTMLIESLLPLCR